MADEVILDDRDAPTYDAVVTRFIELALAAGEEILAVYACDDLGETAKTDASPVTQADTRAEAVILEGLRLSFPGIPLVAEEEASSGRVPATAERFFLVDPLDGTREFIARNGEFTVNLALIEHGVPVVGVVYAPALGEIFAGIPGIPGIPGSARRARVERRTCGEWTAVSSRRSSGELVAIGSRSHASVETLQWLERFAVERIVSSGSSLKFCLLAAGEADIYPRFGRTMEWDTAAGDAILRAAGGIVTDLDGRALTYNKRGQAADIDFANCHFVAYGDPARVHVPAGDVAKPNS